jgi:hypothetical protein
MARSRQRSERGRRQPLSRVDGEPESTSRERSPAPSPTGPEGSPPPAAGVPVKVKFEGTEEERLADIGASAQMLLERILTPPGPNTADEEPPQAGRAHPRAPRLSALENPLKVADV